MKHVIQVEDRYYVLATSTLADDRTRVLKHGDAFALVDRFGDVQEIGSGAQGLYYRGTRYLSRLELLVDGRRPLMLSSSVSDDNAVMTADLTNPDVPGGRGDALPADTVYIRRSLFLMDDTCFSELALHNYGAQDVTLEVALGFDADYADVFEVRGTRRAQRGRRLQSRVEDGRVRLGYMGLDGVERGTCLDFAPAPDDAAPHRVSWRVTLEPGASHRLRMTMTCELGAARAPAMAVDRGYDQALQRNMEEIRRHRATVCHIETSNELFDRWLARSFVDLHMLVTETPHGRYPYAGIPWFSTAFGRDGLITALETLWTDPSMARGVLTYLGARQAVHVVPEQDAEPGKILHEVREGEMAALGEIPFGCYYGSADATPLFVYLLGAYYRRTGDFELVERLWPAMERALAWIDEHGDRDGDGYVEYGRRAEDGLVHQGWKDSSEPVFHADGTLAVGPIALCEVQAYVYGALRMAARLYARRGDDERARTLRARATALGRRFHRDFWLPHLGLYAIALDGRKRPCAVRTSNAGQCLFTGIVPPDSARQLAAALLDDSFFTGFGVRTVAHGEPRYNPLSYHNGSIWPHDNALIAWGLARHGMQREAVRILVGLFEAANFFDLHRMPEVFCGLPRRPGEGPTLYPVACQPQAWAAGAVYLLLQSALGLVVDGEKGVVELRTPELPVELERVRLRGLRVGEGEVDLQLTRHKANVGVEVLRKEGPVRVLVTK